MTATHKIAIALGRSTAVVSAMAWGSLVLLTGDLIPRATLIAATLAVALAIAAYRAVNSDQYWVLLMAATFGAMAPPDLGAASLAFKYVGVLAIGYAISAMLLLATQHAHRRRQAQQPLGRRHGSAALIAPARTVRPGRHRAHRSPAA